MKTSAPKIQYVLARNTLFFSGNLQRGAWWKDQAKARQFSSTNAHEMRTAQRLVEIHGGKLYPV